MSKSINIKPAEPDSYAVVSVSLQHKGRVVQKSVALAYPSKIYAIDAAAQALQEACAEMSKIMEGMKRFAEMQAVENPAKIAKVV